MTTVSTKNLPVGDVQFCDHYVPSLQAGTYEITVSHQVEGVATDIPDATQRFVVKGPRFALDPSDVHAVFPAANSSGRFAESLPHAVMNKRVLPWERELPGQKKSVPWMALLLFDESELIGGDKDSDTKTIASTVRDLLKDDPQVLKPKLGDVSDEDKNMTCRSIEISGAVFKAVVPNLEELEYLAHCRQVNTDDKPILGLKDEGWFSVVIGNRFPRVQDLKAGQNGKNVVHLVSLEGFEDYLGNNPSPIPGEKNVRLVSLASWSFTCLPERGETFKHLVENFVTQEGDDPDNLMLKLPVAPPTGSSSSDPQYIAQKYLSKGYVALSYHTRTGEETFAWYRGPLVPQVAAAIPRSKPFHTASAAMIYDQDTGIFDLSLAAAWQIGRSLALSDQKFATELLKFRRQGHYLINLLLERLHSVHLDSDADLKSLMQNDLIKQKFIQLLRDDVVQTVQDAGKEAMVRPPDTRRIKRVAADSTNPVSVLRDLLNRDDVKSLLEQEVKEDLEPIATWLAKLRLLYDVPFDYLVPDPRMLPPESLRFFYVNQNWLDALTDGALSSGVHTSRDTLYHAMMKDTIRDSTTVVTRQIRDALRGVAVAQDVDPTQQDEATSGILMRSALVSGWPGLAIRAYDDEQPLKMLRMERLSPDVLLCLFLSVPDTLEISEPQEGLQFGVDETGNVELRHVTGEIGQPFDQMQIYDPQHGSFLDFIRPNTRRVLNIKSNSSSDDLATALSRQVKNGTPLTSSDFAIQMVKAPEQLTFTK